MKTKNYVPIAAFCLTFTATLIAPRTSSAATVTPAQRRAGVGAACEEGCHVEGTFPPLVTNGVEVRKYKDIYTYGCDSAEENKNCCEKIIACGNKYIWLHNPIPPVLDATNACVGQHDAMETFSRMTAFLGTNKEVTCD